MNPYARKGIKTTICLFVVIAVFCCFKWFPVKVQMYEVKQSLIQQVVFGTGTLEGKTRLSVSPRETGTIQKLYVDQGDVVKAGDLLAEMISEDIIQQMKAAEAELAVARAVLSRIEAEINSAKADLEYANLTYQRSEKLLSSNIESQSTYDKNRQNMLVARSSLEQVEKSRIEAEATVAKHLAQMTYYEAKLAETRLIAPFDALIVRRNREQGAVVNPGVSIMDIVDLSAIWASVWVDETEIARLQKGLEADVSFRALPQERFKGKVVRLWRETDRETREYKVDIALDELPPNWTLGQRLEVFIKAGEVKKGISIPVNLILWKNNEPFVLCIVDGKIMERPVKLGIRSQNKAEVVSGLKEGEYLVMQPQKNQKYIKRRIKR